MEKVPEYPLSTRLGTLYAQKSELAKAEDQFKCALDVDGEYLPARLDPAWVLIAAKKHGTGPT
jgi:hypothetical protein